MKQTTLILSLILAFLSQSCKKDTPTAPICKTTIFTFDYVTDVIFTDCVGRGQEVQYKAGTHEIESTGVQSVYPYSNTVRIENKLGRDIQVRDLKRQQTIQPDSTYDYTGSNKFSIHFNDDSVKGTATLIVDGEKVQTTDLTSSPVKFFANIPKGSDIYIVLEATSSVN